MDYPHLVRTALTWPSGQLKKGISLYEYIMWLRSAYDGTLFKIYSNYPVNTIAIFNMAASNTRVATKKVESRATT